MRFLVDAQLPRSLATTLNVSGHDAIHTLDLPRANRTADDEISRLAGGDDRVVITKDKDLRQSHVITGSPRRLLLIMTGTSRPPGSEQRRSTTWRPSRTPSSRRHS